jgi:membrane fusion protein (multidrug efflux system)
MKKLILVLGIFALAACSSKHTGDKQAELEKLRKEQEGLAAKIKKLETEIAATGGGGTSKKEKIVALSAVEESNFKHYLEIQGKVEAEQNITLSAKLPGTVSKILVKTGDDVKTGQVLATLDNQVSVQTLQELQSSLAFANNVYQKQKNLWDQKIGSEIQFLTAKNNKESLERKMATLNEQLDMSNIKSPIDGTVDDMMLKLGQTVAPGLPCVRIVNLSILKAKAEVSENYAAKIHQGNEVIVHFPDINKDVKAKVNFAGKVINTLTRTFTVEVLLEANSQDIRPNMLAVLKIADYSNEHALVVPVNVVQNSEEGQYVMVASADKGKSIAKKQIVSVGSVYNGVAEIKTGLTKGEKIITTGYQDLDNGDVVKF